jgi:hypothetical protein
VLFVSWAMAARPTTALSRGAGPPRPLIVTPGAEADQAQPQGGSGGTHHAASAVSAATAAKP